MKKAVGLVVGGALIAGAIVFGIVGIASAQTMPPGGGMGSMRMPGIAGTVSAVSGDTLTVTSGGFHGFGGFGRGQNATSTGFQPGGPIMGTSTTYSVDATNATVMKNGTSSTLSAVNVGDTVFVQGTVTGTNVTATKILDGVVPGGQGGLGGHFGPGPKRGPWNASGTWPGNASGTPPHGSMPGAGATDIIQGNGEPVVGGSVTAINGSMLTVTTASDTVVYTVDASTATIEKRGVASSTVSNIAIGDDVLVQGSVSGTTVAATSVLDQGAPRTASSTNSGGIGLKIGAGIGGFFGAIGNAFHHLFGFF